MGVLAVNKRAGFDYEILETFEAGIVLDGHEVKAVRSGQISLKGSFVTFKKVAARDLPEIYLTNAHISQYRYASTIKNYDPTRPRQLLLQKREIKYLVGKTHQAGLTLVPLKIYTKRSFIKLELAVVRGKKKYDKRVVIKKRELDKQVRTLTKQSAKRF